MQQNSGSASVWAHLARLSALSWSGFAVCLTLMLTLFLPGCGEVDRAPSESTSGAALDTADAEGMSAASDEILLGGGGGLPAGAEYSAPSATPAPRAVNSVVEEETMLKAEPASPAAGVAASNPASNPDERVRSDYSDAAADGSAASAVQTGGELIIVTLSQRSPTGAPQRKATGSRSEVVPETRGRLLTDSDENHGPGFERGQAEEKTGDLPEVPLQSMLVNAVAIENLAVVQVQQTFMNSSARKINAIYELSPGTDAAITGFVMKIGERQIRAIITDQAKAKQLHQEAQQQGLITSIVEQSIDGQISVRIANLEPQASIDVNYSYYSETPFYDGSYEFSFPQFAALPPAHAANRDQQPFRFSLDVQTAGQLESVQCVSHDANIVAVSKQRQQVDVVPAGDMLQEPILVRFRPDSTSVQPVLMTDSDRHGQYFSLALYPPDSIGSESERSLEFVFIIDDLRLDTADRLSQAANIVRYVLGNSRPDDTFRLMTTSGKFFQEAQAAVEVTPEETAKAEKFLRELTPESVSQPEAGLINSSITSTRPPVVFLITDSRLSRNTRQRELGLFAPDRTVVQVCIDEDSSASLLKELHDQRTPVLTNITIDGAVLETHELAADGRLELLPGRPLFIRGRFEGELSSLVVHGLQNGEDVAFSVASSRVSRSLNSNSFTSILGIAWAQDRIARLLTTEQSDSVKAEITELGKSYGLVTPYTSYAVIDALSATGIDEAEDVLIPSVPQNRQVIPNGFNFPPPQEGG